jgi:Dak2 domain-containing protein
VQRYGKAKVGHKTMVDAMVPAVETLKSLLVILPCARWMPQRLPRSKERAAPATCTYAPALTSAK